MEISDNFVTNELRSDKSCSECGVNSEDIHYLNANRSEEAKIVFQIVKTYMGDKWERLTRKREKIMEFQLRRSRENTRLRERFMQEEILDGQCIKYEKEICESYTADVSSPNSPEQRATNSSKHSATKGNAIMATSNHTLLALNQSPKSYKRHTFSQNPLPQSNGFYSTSETNKLQNQFYPKPINGLKSDFHPTTAKPLEITHSDRVKASNQKASEALQESSPQCQKIYQSHSRGAKMEEMEKGLRKTSELPDGNVPIRLERAESNTQLSEMMKNFVPTPGKRKRSRSASSVKSIASRVNDGATTALFSFLELF